jgi:hypothetical protein
VQACGDRWQTLFKQTFGEVTQVTAAAALLAGGWKQLNTARCMAHRENVPWERASEYEIQAAGMIENQTHPKVLHVLPLMFSVDLLYHPQLQTSMYNHACCCRGSIIIIIVSFIISRVPKSDQNLRHRLFLFSAMMLCCLLELREFRVWVCTW